VSRPYSTQISEYFSAVGDPKLSLLLLNKDFNRPTLSVRLRMTIEGQGIRIKTREDVSFTPVSLLAGQPYYVLPIDLSQYFTVNNIELSGLTQQEYIQTGKLPEGFYTFCFEAVETTTGQTVSNKGCAFAWINLNEPPLLNLPAKGESVIPSETSATQNIVFNWTPRHTASPGAAYTTQYIFTLVELTDSSIAPEAGFVNGTPLHVDTTSSSSYQYNNTKPALIIGKRYAWRIQAKTKNSTTGIEIANFKNNGFSEVFWFMYKNNCPPVTGISDSLNGISGYRALIAWLGNPQHLGYKVVYREKNTAGAAWFNITTTGVQAALNDLKPATEYEYRVGCACDEGVYTFAGSRYFTTKDSTNTTVNVPNCGIDPNLTAPTNTNPLATLVAGDTIRAGDFKVVVTNNPAPTGSGGIFTGGGYVPVSYLGNMKLAVTFAGIGISNINNEKRLFSGQIQTTYDPSEGGIASIDEYIDYFTAGYGVGSVVTGNVQVDTIFNFPIQWPGGIVANLPVGYDSLTGIGPVSITITSATPPGASITYVADKLPKVIQDSTGHIYQVNANGTVTSLGQAGGGSVLNRITKDLIDDDRAIVNFVEYNVPKVKYAFDEWKEVYTKSNTFNKEYERIKTKKDNKYYVSAKAIAPATADYLKARLTKTDMSLRYDSIKFISGKGIIYDYKLLDSTSTGIYNYEINIVGGPEKDAQEIYAVYPQTGAKNLNLGKVLVASYPVQIKKLVLVPVNGAPINRDSIANALNRTYGKICVNWDVIVDANFVNDSWDAPPKDGKLQVDGSGTWSELTREMKDLNTAYRTNRAVDSKTVYLFILNQAAVSINGATVFGDMPRGKQFGYLFTNAGIGDNLGKTALHEIGHGTFALKHTFDYNGFTQGLLQPANIMDYPSGEYLTKLQWDYVHDPAVVLGIFQSDEGNLSYSLTGGIPNSWRNKNHTVSFLAPNKKIVCLPKEAVQAYFTFGIGEYSQIPLMPTGVLQGFDIMEGKDKVYYSAVLAFNGNGGSFFNGYAKGTAGIKFTKYASKDSLEEKGNAYVHLPTSNGFTVYRLEGLPHNYVTKDDGQTDVINLKDAASATIPVGAADGWKPINGFDFYHIGSYNVSSKSFNAMFANTMADMDTSQRNTQYLLVAKIMEYRMVYPEIYDRMTSIFNDWTPFKVNAMFALNTLLTLENAPRHFLTTGKADLVGGYFDWLIVKNNWGSKPQNELLVEFLNTFRSLIDAQKLLYNDKIQKIAANNYCPIKDSIWTLSSTDILNVVNTISTDSLGRICPTSRAALIAKILDASDNLIVTDPYEQAIYKLMWTSNKGTERAQFLYELSVVKNSSNKNVLGKLVSAVDDRTLFLGKNFNTMIMNFILNAYKDLMNSTLPFYISNIKPITGVTADNFNTLTEAQRNSFPNRLVSYNYVGVTKRLFKQVLLSLCENCNLFLPTDTKSVVSFDENTNVLNFENKTVAGFVTMNTTTAINYNPLDPIILTDKNNLLDIYDKTASGFYMPAIMLYFLEKKADAKSTVETIQTVVDVASLAIPGGQSTLFYKLLNYADKLSSVSSLIASGTENDYPQFSKYMQLTSSILGLADLSATVYDINKYKNLTSIASTTANTTANTTQLLNRSENVLGALAHEKAVDVLCNDINKLGVIGQTPSTSLSAIVNSPAGKDLELLIQTLEMEKYAANSVGQAGKANQLEIALQKLRTVASGVAQIKTVRVRNIFERMKVQNLLNKTGDGNTTKFFAKANSTNASDQIAHITNNELVIDKIDNLNDLGTTAKLSESIDNARYNINGVNGEKTDDLLFFDDAGTIKCITGVNCFAAQTVVHTKNGTKKIMDITTADTVSSYNENTKGNSWQKVTNVFNKVTKQLQKLIVGKDTLYATPEHTFYTAKGWLQAAAISIGMQLQTSNGFAKVLANNTLDTTTTVYNFTVENTHTYYVGNEQLLTHNDCEKLKDILNSLGDKGKDFLNDFKGSGSQALLDKFYNGQLSVKAWEKLINNPQIRTDISILTSVSKLLDNVNIPQVIKNDIGSIVSGLAAGGLKCRTCPTTGTGYRFIDEIINDLSYVAVNHSDLTGFNKLITNLKAGSTTSVGASYIVDVLKNQQSLLSQFGSLSGFEFKFLSTEDFAVDLVFGSGSSRKFVECKNWGSNLLSLSSESFVKQFANTMKNIGSIAEMKYLFNASRFKPTKTQIVDVLFGEKQLLEAMPEAKLKGYIESYIKNDGLTRAQIETFVNANFDSIFL
jgi:hypothetical protein